MNKLSGWTTKAWYWLASVTCWYSVVSYLDGVRVNTCHHESLREAQMCRASKTSSWPGLEVEMHVIPRFWVVGAVFVMLSMYLSWPEG